MWVIVKKTLDFVVCYEVKEYFYVCQKEGQKCLSLETKILRIELTRKLRNLRYENFVIIWRMKSGITNWIQIDFVQLF
jgi:hypothetical protein